MVTKKAQKFSFIIVSFLIISIFISLLIYIGYCIKAGLETPVLSEENITELIDTVNIEKRMKFHGCLVCWKDPAGVWWFDKDGEQCKLPKGSA
jgi:hypothetical protein